MNDYQSNFTPAPIPTGIIDVNGQQCMREANGGYRPEPPRVYRRVCGSMIRLLFRQRSSLRRMPPLLRSA